MASACPCRRACRSACVELQENCARRRVVVEKDIARGVGDAQLGGQAVADRERRGPAVDEVQAALAHLLQDLEHGLGLGGGAAAHVVVDARRQRHPVEGPVEAAPELVGLETDQDRVGAGIGRADRLHRQVHVDLVAAGAGRGGHGREIVGIGQERQRDRDGQVDRSPRQGRRRPQIVDDDGQLGAACRAPRLGGWQDRSDHERCGQRRRGSPRLQRQLRRRARGLGFGRWRRGSRRRCRLDRCWRHHGDGRRRIGCRGHRQAGLDGGHRHRRGDDGRGRRLGNGYRGRQCRQQSLALVADERQHEAWAGGQAGHRRQGRELALGLVLRHAHRAQDGIGAKDRGARGRAGQGRHHHGERDRDQQRRGDVTPFECPARATTQPPRDARQVGDPRPTRAIQADQCRSSARKGSLSSILARRAAGAKHSRALRIVNCACAAPSGRCSPARHGA